MVCINGKVQLFEDKDMKDISVGTPFAIKNVKGEWVNIKGDILTMIKVDMNEVKRKIELKKKNP